jgi:hypothetical protein
VNERRGQRGQASVELLGALPVVLVLGLVLLQLFALGYSRVLAGSAAEAGALAVAAGGDARASARKAVPRWSRARMQVSVGGGRVQVRMRPPSPLRAMGRTLEVRAAAAVAR